MPASEGEAMSIVGRGGWGSVSGSSKATKAKGGRHLKTAVGQRKLQTHQMPAGACRSDREGARIFQREYAQAPAAGKVLVFDVPGASLLLRPLTALEYVLAKWVGHP